MLGGEGAKGDRDILDKSLRGRERAMPVGRAQWKIKYPGSGTWEGEVTNGPVLWEVSQ